MHLETLDEPALRSPHAARLADVSGSTGYGPWGSTGDAPHATWDALLAVGNDAPGGRIHPWREPLASSPLGSGPFDGCAYNAFRGRWDELEATTRRLRAAVERQPVAEP